MDLTFVLQGALPPVVAGLLLVSLGGARLLPLAGGIGMIVAHGLLKSWPAWPHELWRSPNGTQWLVWGAGALGVFALLEHASTLPRRLAPALGAVAGMLAAWLVLAKVAARWSSGEVLLGVGIAALVTAALSLLGRAVLQRAPQAVGPAGVLALLLSLDALLLTLGSSAFLGQLAGALAAAVGAAAFTAWWRRPFALAPADGAWLFACHGLFLIAGLHLAYLPWPAAGLALAAPVALWFVPGSCAGRPLLWPLVASLLMLPPLLAALWLAGAAVSL